MRRGSGGCYWSGAPLQGNRWHAYVAAKVIEKIPAVLNPLCWERTGSEVTPSPKAKLAWNKAWHLLLALASWKGLQTGKKKMQRSLQLQWHLQGLCGLLALPCSLASPTLLLSEQQLSQAHRDNSSPVLAKVTLTKLMWLANPTVQRVNFNKRVQGALTNTLGIVSNPGLG